MTLSRALVLSTAFGSAVVGLVPAANAALDQCHVHNTKQDTSYSSTDGTALADAIADAAPDDRLRARVRVIYGRVDTSWSPTSGGLVRNRSRLFLRNTTAV